MSELTEFFDAVESGDLERVRRLLATVQGWRLRATPIDDYQLIVCPLVPGSGRPLFGDKIGSVGMRLLKTIAARLCSRTRPTIVDRSVAR